MPENNLEDIRLLQAAYKNTQAQLAVAEEKNRALQIQLEEYQDLLKENRAQLQILRSAYFPFLRSIRHLKAYIKC